MSSWGKTDAFGSAPLWALASVNKQPVVANMGAAGSGKLFKNETASNLITGITRGLFNYNASEVSAGQLSGDGSTLLTTKGIHSGWVLRNVGSGGRAGRVTGETLVCLTSN